MSGELHGVFIIIIIVMVQLCVTLQFLDQTKEKEFNQFVEDSGGLDTFQEFKIIKEDDLIDILPKRLANIGPAFIARDTVSALLAKDEGGRTASWTLAIVGVLAFVTQRLSMELKNLTNGDDEDDDVAGRTFLETTSKILGVGVGVVALSNDFNNVITSSRCLNDQTENDTTITSKRRSSSRSGEGWSSSLMSMSMPTSGSSRDCGRFVFVNYLANLMAFGADLFAILVPPAGPYAAMFAIFKTIATTYLELWSWDAFA